MKRNIKSHKKRLTKPWSHARVKDRHAFQMSSIVQAHNTENRGLEKSGNEALSAFCTDTVALGGAGYRPAVKRYHLPLHRHLALNNCLSNCNKWANIHLLTDISIHSMCLCMLLISPSRGKLHQMHLLGNGAQRELLTSQLLQGWIAALFRHLIL